MAAAASYAPPATMFSSDRHGHGHGRHSNSQNSKSMTQRASLQPSGNGGSLGGGGAQWNCGSQVNGHILPNPLKPYTHAHFTGEADAAKSNAAKTELTHQEHPNPPIPLSEQHHLAIGLNGRPKSMERRRSSAGLPTHLRLGSSGYGYPLPSSPKYVSSNDGEARKWITMAEAISSVLVPLPYMLASLAFGAHRLLHQQFLQTLVVGPWGKPLLGSISSKSANVMKIDHGTFPALLLASSTLLLVGVKGKISGPPTMLDRRKHSLGRKDKGVIAGVRRTMERTIGVGLPFYATTKLGSDRVALVMLAALAADITNVEDETTDLISSKGWKRLLNHRRWTLASITLQILGDFMGLSTYCSTWELLVGYFALLVSIFFISPPFPSLKVKASPATSFSPASPASTPKLLATQWQTSVWTKPVPGSHRTTSPLVCTTEDINLTLAAGTALGMLSCLILLVSRPGAGAVSFLDLGLGFLSVCAAALSYQLVQPQAIRKNSGIGLLIGSLTSLSLMKILRSETWSYFAYQGIFIGITFAATKLDTRQSLSTCHTQHQSHNPCQHANETAIKHNLPSRFSRFILESTHKWPLLHSILAEKDSRRIFYFMCLNFTFMLVQTFYGIATGSLGLLSDSIHMFFDCLALVVGLCAAVMSKWPPSPRFPYGYGKMDTLAGFANGIFLMLISIEIVYEAIERLAEGSEMKRIGELLTVSSLGLVVNLVGMTAFGHAHHGHSHGGHSHAGHSDHSHPSHDEKADHAHHRHHGTNDHDHLHDHLHAHPTPSPLSPLSSIPATPLTSVSLQSHSHSHEHKHSHHEHHHHHGNENMHGIFLHVMADTLGSLAVVISTLLVHFYGWSGFDPLASCLIAILIFASAIPLVTSSARTLLLTVPPDTEFDLRESLSGISGLRGVVGYAVPKFWLEEGEEKRVLGVIHVIAAKGADLEDVKERAVAYLRGRHMEVLVQVERDGSDRCWCRGGIKN